MRKKVGIVILAAGGSTRFGSPKQLFEYQGQSLIRRAAMSAISCDSGPVIVSTRAETIEPELSGLHVIPVFNPRWPTGMASSLTSGLEYLTGSQNEIDAVIFMLCDQPLIDGEKLFKLIHSYEETGCPIVASEYSGTLGVPALFDRSMFDELMRLTGDEGAKSVIKNHLDQVARVPMPEAAFDIDSMSDIENR
jgi:molybdenum cofactor cytidylyltransferase